MATTEEQNWTLPRTDGTLEIRRLEDDWDWYFSAYLGHEKHYGTTETEPEWACGSWGFAQVVEWAEEHLQNLVDDPDTHAAHWCR
jgi:hypothetical protein